MLQGGQEDLGRAVRSLFYELSQVPHADALSAPQLSILSFTPLGTVVLFAWVPI